VAVSLVFAGNGVLFASLFARLPEVQERLALSDGELGLALLGAPIGLVTAVWPAGAWIARAGSKRVGAVGAAAYVAALVLPALATGLPTLIAAMLALGASSGMLDVAMNAQGVAVERGYPRRIFASLHAAFSFGALAGAVAGGLVAEAGVPLAAHLLATGALIGAAYALAIPRFVPDDGAAPSGEAPAARRRPALVRPSGPLLMLGVVALVTLLAEGALNDWSAVYLSGVHDAGPGLAAAGLAAFSTAMGVGRLAGDPLAERIGSARLARSGLLVAAAGYTGAALAPSAGAALAAFVTLGLGLSSVYPLCLRMATELPGVSTAGAIAAVTTTGYTGFLAGPPLVGFVAEATSLRVSLAALGLLCLVGAGNIRRAQGVRAG
jgi:MFS family permease